jgi:hypothetical protein
MAPPLPAFLFVSLIPDAQAYLRSSPVKCLPQKIQISEQGPHDQNHGLEVSFEPCFVLSFFVLKSGIVLSSPDRTGGTSVLTGNTIFRGTSPVPRNTYPDRMSPIHHEGSDHHHEEPDRYHKNLIGTTRDLIITTKNLIVTTRT